MLWVNYNQKQVNHHVLLLDLKKTLHITCMVLLDNDRISLTRHCAVMVWFQGELTDAVM